MTPATTMEKQLRLSLTGNSSLGLAITIERHLNQCRTRKLDPNVTPEPTTVV